MKKLLTIGALVSAATLSFAQGTVNFANGSTTLISAGGAAMPTSATGGTFNFAVFLAPSTTVNAVGLPSTPSYTDPLFQQEGVNGTVNSPTAVGRLVTRNGVVVGGVAGSTIDFIVRGWSANAGATWAEALAFYNGGSPSQAMYIGQSLIGNDLKLGDGAAVASTTLFGLTPVQVGGFNLALIPAVPEPTSMVLAGLGAASLLLFRRRN
jgi:hypothetical protein